ncbi:hypothetical protein METBIDRAFT_30520 [Metschnikowia bicuspidata var. bicuspidata NRRL YB-4993]|uniref:Uncharacterized protein n=1 Tax=Metschnikowia bicuspidata var. bicuspidata NRRL YB-4993 TaxID=869754 RepID=A0A1A0HJJ6_9ASCO|nr:hypothetical protein METBIDRAFT_30520 [Metschnikowia bicuspidata var. bicuspidata NRRL YB-4993]OBA24185.1 hypothetical protein METBIDRAFT_30520 [Metschnikowia bicuspidata var. bicuspidata NRRL YB-4993]
MLTVLAGQCVHSTGAGVLLSSTFLTGLYTDGHSNPLAEYDVAKQHRLPRSKPVKQRRMETNKEHTKKKRAPRALVLWMSLDMPPSSFVLPGLSGRRHAG